MNIKSTVITVAANLLDTQVIETEYGIATAWRPGSCGLVKKAKDHCVIDRD